MLLVHRPAFLQRDSSVVHVGFLVPDRLRGLFQFLLPSFDLLRFVVQLDLQLRFGQRLQRDAGHIG